MIRGLVVALLLLGSVPSALAALQSSTSATPEAANALYAAKDFASALAAYEALVREKPQDPALMMRLGTTLHQLGRFAEALSRFAEARKLGFPPGQVDYWTARAEARLGRSEAALASLQKATDQGFGQKQTLEAEADLAALRGDAAFAPILAAADRNDRPCAYRPETKAFDFWVGDWEVTVRGSGVLAGTSHVEKILQECIVFENWTGVGGYSGKSFNLWDPMRKRWQQTWVDSAGGLTEYHGEARDGGIYYMGEAAVPGQAQPNRIKMTFLRLEDGSVRQFGETSRDGGQTWTVTFDLVYRKKA